MDETVLADELSAIKKGYQFKVAIKASKHAQWITVHNNISRLTQAFDLAKNI